MTNLEGQSYAFSSKKIVQKNVTKLPTTSPHLFNVEPTVVEKLDDSRCDIIEIGFNNSSKKTYHVSELYKKNATGLYIEKPDVPLTEQQWAEKQILESANAVKAVAMLLHSLSQNTRMYRLKSSTTMMRG